MGFFSAVRKFFGQKGPQDAESVEVREAGAPDGLIAETDVSQRGDGPHAAAGEAARDGDMAVAQPGYDGAVLEREDLAGADAEAAEIAERPAGADSDAGPEHGDEELLLRLRQAEPRLSAWLAIILEGQDRVGDEFWRRLRFLLGALEAPQEEISAFVSDFSVWLDRMEYTHVDEFRSELQYRLALALDLEDEEDERSRLLVKLGEGLAATRARLGRGLEALVSGHASLDDAFWEELEELFITSDMGYETSIEMVARLRRRARNAGAEDPGQIPRYLREELGEVFRQPVRIRAANRPEVILMMGVNGAGKTTTIAKLAYRERLGGKKVLIVAADTFRAAAIEQLGVWAERAGVEFYARPAGSDPASVAWGGMEKALAEGFDVVFIDTAGRLQTRVNLMEELGKIRQVAAKKHPGAPHRNILVLDATTGQNALSQARLFREAAGADEIILTKLDGTAKGGVAISVCLREGLPISFIGIGEKMEDLRPFNGGDFAAALLDDPARAGA